MICKTCKENKAEDLFPLYTVGRYKIDKRKPHCRVCCNKRARIYNEKQRKNDPEKARRAWRNCKYKQLYNLDLVTYEKMYENQGGRCKICQRYEDLLHVDHCHTTEEVRSLLCGPCNLGLGAFKDNISSLTRAAEYIRFHQIKTNKERGKK